MVLPNRKRPYKRTPECRRPGDPSPFNSLILARTSSSEKGHTKFICWSWVITRAPLSHHIHRFLFHFLENVQKCSTKPWPIACDPVYSWFPTINFTIWFCDLLPFSNMWKNLMFISPSCSHSCLDHCLQSIFNFQSSSSTMSRWHFCSFTSASSKHRLSSRSSSCFILVKASYLFLFLSFQTCFRSTIRRLRRPSIFSTSPCVWGPWLSCMDHILSTSSLNPASCNHDLSTLKYVGPCCPSFVAHMIGIWSESGLKSDRTSASG